jgi:hypothetical protein
VNVGPQRTKEERKKISRPKVLDEFDEHNLRCGSGDRLVHSGDRPEGRDQRLLGAGPTQFRGGLTRIIHEELRKETRDDLRWGRRLIPKANREPISLAQSVNWTLWNPKTLTFDSTEAPTARTQDWPYQDLFKRVARSVWPRPGDNRRIKRVQSSRGVRLARCLANQPIKGPS